MENKFYQVTKEINGVEYTAQFNGISAALESIDNSYIDNSQNTSIKKLANYILKNVIVVPSGLTPDSFDDMNEFNEVIKFGREVMQGNFRDTKDKGATKEASTK